MNLSALIRLARLDKPVGILLLWAPTAWALWLANEGHPPFMLTVLFLLGTIIMRSAGCVLNDMVDRQIDPYVERTKNRPLAANEIGLEDALAFLIVLLFFALLILLQLPKICFYFALVALAVVGIYPFCKRFIQCPQFVLGIAFSLGIPMAFAASGALSNSMMYYLFAINLAWIVAYDTQYAMVDRVDDMAIGVKSSAIWFANKDRQIIAGLQIFFHLLWLPSALDMGFSWRFYLIWGGASFILLYQQALLASGEEKNYFKAFSSNTWYGALMWVGLMVA
jgi:4-hydroxybenzoate polyprenyltransferase